MNIKAKRIEKGLLQKEVLKDTGLLSKIENGKAIACPEDIERFAVIFECEPKDLFTDAETAYFGEKLVGGKVIPRRQKQPRKGVCKSGMLRKCFWLDRETNDALLNAIKALGFRTSQAWFEEVVCNTLKEVAPTEKEKFILGGITDEVQ